jgi:hypothetical protein
MFPFHGMGTWKRYEKIKKTGGSTGVLPPAMRVSHFDVGK